MEAATDGYVAVQAGIGTPQEVVEKYRRRREAIGTTSIISVFQYRAMPYEMAESSMRLFADEVIPELRAVAEQPGPRPDGRSRVRRN